MLAASAVSADNSAQGAFAQRLQGMGKVYTNQQNEVIQSIKFFGRAHGQWNYSDGDSAGSNFNGSGEELRRLRMGASISFLHGFTAFGRVNLEAGGFGNTSLDYESWDELYLQYRKKYWLGFDSAGLSYGRHKLLFGAEEHQSSNSIKTIERSAINNRFGSRRPTGLVFKANHSDSKYIIGIWSREPEPKHWAGWNEGIAVQFSTEFTALEGAWIQDFIYAGGEDNTSGPFDYHWASSTTYTRDFGRYNLMLNLTFSEAGDVDPLGIVLLPSFFVLPDKLEAAFRYQWANSSDNVGVPRSSSSRGIRRIASDDRLASGAGDDYHALYAGLNYYIAGPNLKIMTGVEYETIRGDSARQLDGYSLWLAARVYF